MLRRPRPKRRRAAALQGVDAALNQSFLQSVLFILNLLLSSELRLKVYATALDDSQ